MEYNTYNLIQIKETIEKGIISVKSYLINNRSYPWFEQDNIHIRGYFIYKQKLYTEKSAIFFLSSIFNLNEDAFTNVVQQLNGIFSIFIERSSDVVLISDRLRGLPLFYSVDGEITISDDASYIVKFSKLNTLDKYAVKEYKASGLFISGYETLINGLYQVQASEIVYIQKKSKRIIRKEYFHYRYSENSYTEAELKQAFYDNYDRIAENLVLSLRNRTAVVPLSGGADSRMIASLLHKKSYDKVICYTYGKKDNSEAKISKEVASFFGFPWYMVEYTPEMWKNYRKSCEYLKYERYASNYVSTTHIQDIMAITKLIEDGIIPEDAVFIPGHSGDMIAGSHLTSIYMTKIIDYESFIDMIIKKFYNNADNQYLHEKMKDRFNNIQLSTNEGFSREMEWFNAKERQAKFIINSCRAYEFMGHEWLIPLWDNSQFEFWSKVPIKLRYGRKLYFQCVTDSIKSTNDQTPITSMANFIRNVHGLNTIARKARRLKSFFSSKLGYERFFPFSEYLKACICMPPTFTINDLLCREYLKRLEHDIF